MRMGVPSHPNRLLPVWHPILAQDTEHFLLVAVVLAFARLQGAIYVILCSLEADLLIGRTAYKGNALPSTKHVRPAHHWGSFCCVDRRDFLMRGGK
jgi:hypothetical protein